MGEVNIGILGAAKIAPKGIIWPAQDHKDCQIYAVASRNIEKAKTFAEEHNILNFYADYESLIADENINLVYNALPPNRHADLTIAALAKGKSVLCEKPFAMNVREAKAMIDAAENSEGYLIEAFHYRFHPAVLKFLELAQTGSIGQLVSMRGIFNVSIPNRPGELRYIPELGGGAMMDLGCYVLHFMRLVAGSEPTIMSARAQQTDSGVDVAMQSHLQFEQVTAELICNMQEGTERTIRFLVEGQAGRLSFEQFIHPYREFEIKLETDSHTQIISNSDASEIYNRPTYAYQLDHVLKILDGQTDPFTGGQDALLTMKAMDDIYRLAGFER